MAKPKQKPKVRPKLKKGAFLEHLNRPANAFDCLARSLFASESKAKVIRASLAVAFGIDRMQPMFCSVLDRDVWRFGGVPVVFDLPFKHMVAIAYL